MRKKLKRSSKYLIGLSIILVCVNAFLGFILTRQSAESMRTLISERMLDISNTAASMLDGDELAAVTKDDFYSQSYQRILRTLTYFQENIELEYIYCISDAGNGNFVFSVDPTVMDPGEFGSPIVYTDALYQASLGKAAVDTTPYEDDWGRFYSAYSPVFTSDNRVGGIVAVDFSAKWYEDQIAKHVWTTAVTILIAMIIGAALVVIISLFYKKRFTILFKGMNSLSEGIEELVHEVSHVSEDGPVKPAEPEIESDDEMLLLVAKVGAMQKRLSDQIAFIHAQAYFDGLTGLGNRMAYEGYIKALEEKMAAGNAEFSVAVFDINQLKIINDDFGHEEGDHVISEAADAISRAFEGEKNYRIGGDEFVSILQGNPEEKIEKLRAILKQKNENETLLKAGGLGIAVSVGAATYDPEKDKEFSDVFERADQAMYLDKKAFYMTHEDRRKMR